MLDLTRLTAEQCRVVLAPDGPVAVVAGPGSGKTTVLAARVAHLVAGRGVDPASVLALTFTAAAARALRDRLVAVLGEPGRRVDVATFHSWGLRVVRRWSAELGYASGTVAVHDEDDAQAVLREAAADVGVEPPDGGLGELRRAVERHRLCGAGPDEAGRLGRLAGAYEALLRRGAVDFAGMLVLPLRLLSREPRALHFYRELYRHVLADECQDTCDPQHRLLGLLAARHRNLVAVGDPWQSVFGWRGADGAFLERLHRDFPEARTLVLSENFRATGRLVALANAVGRPLGRRRLWTRNAPGAPARLHRASDEAAEAAYVAAEIARLGDRRLVDGPEDVAVLYRTNRQAEEIALALKAGGIPFRVRGRGDPLGRRELRDALAYLRLALDRGDAGALARVLDAPPRGLGRPAERLRRHPLGLDELLAAGARPGSAEAGALERLAALVDELHAASRRLRPDALLALTLERSGYRAWLAGQPDGATRAEHLRCLEAAVGRAGDDLTGWLAEPSVGEGEVADGPGVLLSSVHLAKGAEWRAVFLIGAEEGLLPHARALFDGDDAVADEVRIAYVAVTRARDRLYVTHCRTRRLADAPVERVPSRFFGAIPPGLLTPAGRAA